MKRPRRDSQDLLKRLRATLADVGDGQTRLNHIVEIIADSMGAEVCSIYLRRDRDTLELCATEGLEQESVHQTRLRFGDGLVGRVAKEAEIINAENAPSEKGFRYMPETGEEKYTSLLGIPIQRLGDVLGVLVVQNKDARHYSDDEVYALEVVAMVIAEMKELGAFVGEGDAMSAPHQRAHMIEGTVAQEGAARGNVLLHDARVIVMDFVTEDPEAEKQRLTDAMEELRRVVDKMLTKNLREASKEHRDVLEAYRMFANSRGWYDRMLASIDRGLAAEVAVEKEQSETRAKMARIPDAYLRERLQDLDDLSNRLLRILTGQGAERDIPENPILVARNIGPGELLEYGKKLKGIVLEEGSVGGHAAIVARAWAIPMVINAKNITLEALNKDAILVDGDQGVVHLRPDESVQEAFKSKIAMQQQAAEKYEAIRDEPALSLDGHRITMLMNAGLLLDLPSLEPSGAEGVGLFRTELQFLSQNSLPKRAELAQTYATVMDSAQGRPVTFRTLDIGSDKVLPYMKRTEEPNPAMGWRAIRLGLEKSGVMRVQLQALLRGAKGRPLRIMFPMVAQFDEFQEARKRVLDEVHREGALGHVLPENVEIGAMLETPSLAFAPDAFFELADFISIGGNDLKQFFFAADRENERVRKRYDTLNISFLSFIEMIAQRCDAVGTPVSFCGEDAGRPLEALCFTAMGLRQLSMRAASIGPVKHLLRKANLGELQQIIHESRNIGDQSVREKARAWVSSL